MRYLALTLVALALCGCGLHKKNKSSDDFSQIVGTWDAVCTQVSGSAPASTINQHRTVVVMADGLTSTTDILGNPVTYHLSGNGGHYIARRQLSDGSYEELSVTASNGSGTALISDSHTSYDGPYYAGTGWSIVRTSSG